MRGGLQHMYNIAKKKPALQAIIDNIDNYDDASIDLLVEYQVWIRKLLKGILEAKRKEVRMAELAETDSGIVAGLTIPAAASEVYVKYEVRQYVGVGCLINASCQGAMAFDVSENDIFFVVDDIYVKINSMAVKCIGKDRINLKNNSKFIDNMYIADYNHYLQKLLDVKLNGGTVEDPRNSEYGYLSAIRYSR